MDVLLTPDNLTYLGVTNCTITFSGKQLYFALLGFSHTHIAFISVQEMPRFVSPVMCEIRSSGAVSLLNLIYEGAAKTSTKHWVIKFKYFTVSMNDELQTKWESLLHITDYKQLRKEERIVINKNTFSLLRLSSAEIIVWTKLNVQKTAVCRDLSYSGSRLFLTDDSDLDCDDKIVLRIPFERPSEIATLRATIIRKNSFEINSVPCIDIAVRFLDPVDFVLLSRITRYFELASSEAN
jgi:hypothetical protein